MVLPVYAGTPSSASVKYVSFWESEYPVDHTTAQSKINEPLFHLGGTPVISSPFVNQYETYDNSNLIVNYSSINKDLAALKQRQRYEKFMFEQAHVHHIRLPLIELSGELETQIYTLRDFAGKTHNDIDLTAAEFDIQGLVTPWITGLLAFDYDNSPPSSGQRISNSHVYLDSGFITFGNLNYYDGYLTLGQLYMPFGQFDSYSITSPFNKTLFRTKGRGINIGYKSSGIAKGLYGQAFIFKGDSRTGHYEPNTTVRSRSANINQYGVNLGYLWQQGPWSVSLGSSYINNVTDADGMQSTGNSTFGGFGVNTASEVIQHRVPGWDLRGKLSYGPFSFFNEYTTALRNFDMLDLTYNGKGARPYGYHAEGVYQFEIYHRPSTFALAYDQTGEALALNVPRRGYGVTLNITVWRNTFLSIEARRDENYGSNDSASGHGSANFGPVGKYSNSLTGQLDIYF